MIDGRSIYTPLRSEILWDVQDKQNVHLSSAG